jgi:uncharacterized cupredoxin-like copper-binding protein
MKIHPKWGDRPLVSALIAAVLAIVCAAGPSLAASAHAKSVTVRMTEYMFSPDHLTFQRGVLYRLHLANQGKEIHEFTAPEFIAAIDLKNPSALGAYTNQFAVDPGQTKDVFFIPLKPGRYKLVCADHDWAGMIGEIVITP